MRFALPLASTAFLLASFLYTPKPPTLCFSRRVVSIACPGCGLVRSVTSLARGDWRASIRHHLFGPLVFLAGVVVWILSIRGLLKGEPYRLPESRRANIALGVTFGLFIVYWVVRTATGTAP